MAYLALGGFGPVFDLGEQRRLDPDAATRDALAVGWIFLISGFFGAVFVEVAARWNRVSRNTWRRATSNCSKA
jgi:hypothetical protein